MSIEAPLESDVGVSEDLKGTISRLHDLYLYNHAADAYELIEESGLGESAIIHAIQKASSEPGLRDMAVELSEAYFPDDELLGENEDEEGYDTNDPDE